MNTIRLRNVVDRLTRGQDQALYWLTALFPTHLLHQERRLETDFRDFNAMSTQTAGSFNTLEFLKTWLLSQLQLDILYFGLPTGISMQWAKLRASILPGSLGPLAVGVSYVGNWEEPWARENLTQNKKKGLCTDEGWEDSKHSYCSSFSPLGSIRKKC